MNPAPQVAAFFDIDGTLLAPPSLERQLLRFLAWRREITARHWARWLASAARHVWRDPLAATHGNKAQYTGVRVATVEAFLALFRRHAVTLFPGALARMQWHTSRGHKIFLVSGTLHPLAATLASIITPVIPAASDSASIHVEATRLETSDRRFTGRVEGEAVCGRGKGHGVLRLARLHGLDLVSSYAYGNQSADRWMLEAVGHPATVNPSWRLARLAQRRGWPILEWLRTEQRSVNNVSKPLETAAR